MSDARERGIEAVRKWSKKIHGASDRHDWCMQAATAVLDRTEVPKFPGRPMPGVPAARLDTIKRILFAEGAISE